MYFEMPTLFLLTSYLHAKLHTYTHTFCEAARLWKITQCVRDCSFMLLAEVLGGIKCQMQCHVHFEENQVTFRSQRKVLIEHF